MAAVLLVVRPLCFVAHGVLVNQIVNPGPVEHDPVAEPLARGAAKLDILPERLRRTHRQPGPSTGPALRESLVMAFDAAGIFSSTAPAPWSCWAGWTGG